MVRAFRAAAWVLVFFACVVPCEAAWHRLDSPNFVVVGDASPRDLRDIAVKFEAFRESLARLRRQDAPPAPVPTVIIAFRSEKSFRPFMPRYEGRVKQVGGLFMGHGDVNHIALLSHVPFSVGPVAEQLRARIIYHEYAHLLISDEFSSVPVWLNEGLAELYSTFEMSREGRQIVIGRFIAEHLALLNTEPLLKLSDLLQVDHSSPLYNEGEMRSVFYAQSWALMHMIQFGEPSRTRQLAAYLQRLSQGMQPTAAWAEAFGDDPIEAELRRYIRAGKYKAVKAEFPEKLSRFDAVAKPIGPLEVQAFLAQFLLAQGRADEAATQLAGAGKGAEQNATAAVVAAQLSIARGDYAGAIEQLAGLREPEDWLMAYHAGVAIGEAIEHTQDARPDLRAAAGRFFDAASRTRPFPNAAVRRAALDMAPDRVPADATILEVQAARAAAPGREDYAFVHAQLLALRSDFAAARSVVGPLMASADSPRIRESARSLMKWILELEKHHTSRAAAGHSPEPPASPNVTGAAPDAEISRLQPVFRETKSDEERLEGVLQRIDCAGRSVAFVLQTTDEVVRLAAPRMDVVEFITYRDDLSGSVSCGPLKEPMRVYVTSRASAKASGPREVVAVEFLPKEIR